jgi:hypothetical protein
VNFETSLRLAYLRSVERVGQSGDDVFGRFQIRLQNGFLKTIKWKRIVITKCGNSSSSFILPHHLSDKAFVSAR